MNGKTKMIKNLFLLFIVFSLFACASKKETLDSSNKASSKRPILSEEKRVLFGRTYIDGSKAKILEDFERAETLFQNAIKIDPYSAAAHFELGSVYGLLGKNDLAFKEFQRANELDPSNYWYKLSYATFLQSEQKIKESIKVFKELVEENPEKIELKYELSKLLFGVREYKESIHYLNKIENDIGVNEEISFLKQRIYLSQNNIEAATEEVRKLIDKFPENINYYGVLADIYLSNNLQDKALEVYEQMQKLAPENYLVQFSLAEYHRSEGNQEAYLISLKKAFSNSEMDIDDKIKYFLNFYQVNTNNKEKKEEGLELCERIVEAHPENAKSHALHGDFLYFNNQVEDAKEAYKQTIAIDSSRFPIWNQLLVIFSETRDNAGLLNYGKRATSLFPNQPTVFLLYGLGLSEDKQHTEAIKVYEYATDLVIDNQALKSQLYSSIGDSYHEIGNHVKSDENYEKALSLDPNNVYVLNNYSYYLSLRKENLEKAKQMSLKSNELAPNQASFQDTYAWILYQLSEYKEANKWIDKALSTDGSSAVLLEHKGDIMYQLGDVEAAVKYWKKAKAAGSDSKLLDKKIEEKKLYE
tara:strand:- start:11072 stop:12826 length:1755 start_codon:yes stop_codon:yes gene_type:complete